MIIAVDGTAASGKGTLAKRLARHYRLNYLDTGSLYRAVAVLLVQRGTPLGDSSAAIAAAQQLDINAVDPQTLREPGIGEAASIVAAIPEVRAALLEHQRTIASRPPGAVLDGRDIGTVVCPDAEVKLFVNAALPVRAKRRFIELQALDPEVVYEKVLADIQERDRRDAGRTAAPMQTAPDAHLLDTSELDIEATFRLAVELIDAELRGGSASLN